MKETYRGLPCDGCGEFFGILQRVRFIEGDTVTNYDLCPVCFAEVASRFSFDIEHCKNVQLRAENKNCNSCKYGEFEPEEYPCLLCVKFSKWKRRK